jgi:hypothetical protein
MARPRKPEVGTAERLRMDLAEFGKVHDLIAARIRAAGGARGSKAAAIRAAAKAEGIDEKTAERHYNRVRRSITPGAVLLLAGADVRRAWTNSGLDDALALAERAFSEDELHKLAQVEAPLIWQLAQERIELIELRKRRNK